jgi:tRNA (cmo5U34)-methyltransferase
MKSSVDQIRARFDADVERFSSLETGQAATIDSPLALELIAEAAAASTPGARAVLDVGCGAGNYALRLLHRLPGLDVTLLDLSRPMLERAAERVGAATAGRVSTVQADVRDARFDDGAFDVILAASVLHHLRTDEQWERVFASFHRWLRPGGSVWVFDLVAHESADVQSLMWRRYGEYLVGLKGEAYRDTVFGYVEDEDTPRPLTYQIDLLRRCGFRSVDVLHKNGPFAAFGAAR